MESTKETSKEQLLETIESLKEENEKTRDELMQKVRALEGEQLKSNVSNRQLEGKIKELKGTPGTGINLCKVIELRLFI